MQPLITAFRPSDFGLSGFGRWPSLCSSRCCPAPPLAAPPNPPRPPLRASSSMPARGSFARANCARRRLPGERPRQPERAPPAARALQSRPRPVRPGRRGVEEGAAGQADRRPRPSRRPAGRRRHPPGQRGAGRQRRAEDGRRLHAWPGRAQGVESGDRGRAARAEGARRRPGPMGARLGRFQERARAEQRRRRRPAQRRGRGPLHRQARGQPARDAAVRQRHVRQEASNWAKH